MCKRYMLASVWAGFLTSVAAADITVYHDFFDYHIAVGGVHTLSINFFNDSRGNLVIPSEDFDGNGYFDIEGSVFSNLVVYSSPDFPSSRVNIGYHPVVDNYIGSFNVWDGTLAWDYSTNYIATAFTGGNVEPSTVLRLFSGDTLVGQTTVGGVGEDFAFFGFVSTVAFDRAELDGLFFAIDQHWSTVPGPAALTLLGLGGLTMGRRRRK